MSDESGSGIPVSVYADLAAAAYADLWSLQNRVLVSDLPSGWSYLKGYNQFDTKQGLAALLGSGFSASVFVNGKNIVISFEGTDFDNVGKLVKDGLTDATLATGVGSLQLFVFLRQNGQTNEVCAYRPESVPIPLQYPNRSDR